MCDRCGFVHYRNPAPAVGVILEQQGQVLLVLRKFEPRSAQWSLPAGFIEYDESPIEAALRETKEETGLDIQVTSLLDVYGACDDPRVRVVLVVYEGRILDGEVRPGDDAAAAQFFPLDALPENMAFSSHLKALEVFREKHRGTAASASAAHA